MNKYTREELLEQLPVGIRETKELYPNPKVVLGQLMIYDGLEKKDKDGYFYRSNLDLKDDCSIKEEKTVIAAVRKLASLGFVDTVRGSRKGASLYRINKKTIDDYCKSQVGDYCKKEIEDYSNDYSKQIAEMTSRIKELENTVKMLVDKITVIEGKDYSTDTDKEIEIDKEIDINNNILNNNSLYNINNNILEVTSSNKELEKEESEENLTVSQLVLTESQASSPIEELSQASTVTDSTDVGETQTSTEDDSVPVKQQMIPTEDEQYQQWLQVLNPYLKELEDAKTLKQFEYIKIRLKRYGGEYLDCHEDTSPTVIEKMNKVLGTALKSKKSELTPDEMELSDYVSRIRKYGSL